jgi:hypothetical protein
MTNETAKDAPAKNHWDAICPSSVPEDIAQPNCAWLGDSTDPGNDKTEEFEWTDGTAKEHPVRASVGPKMSWLCAEDIRHPNCAWLSPSIDRGNDKQRRFG